MFPFRRNSQACSSAGNIQQHRNEAITLTTPVLHICTYQHSTLPVYQNSWPLSGSCTAIALLN